MTTHSTPALVSRLVRQRPLLVALVAAVPVVEYLARLQGAPGPSIAILRNPFAAIAAASVFCRYLFADSRRRARKSIVYLSPFVVSFALAGLWRGEPVQLAMMKMLVALGALGAVGFVLAASRSPDQVERADFLGQMMDALLLPVAASIVSFGLWSTSRVNPVYDARIYSFEEILGVNFSRLFVASYQLVGPLNRVGSACYATIALGIALTAAAQRNARREAQILTSAVVAGACGFALYFICPAVGPFEAFGSAFPNAFPQTPSGAPLMTVALDAPRNAMPSLHTVWALLIWFNARPLPSVLRRGLRLFVFMNLWAAMGLQEHWLTDIVVACPLAVAIQLAVVHADDFGRRWADVFSCALITAAWLVGFRTAEPLLRTPAILAWAAMVFTAGWPLWRAQHAARALEPSSQGASVRATNPEQVDRRLHEVLES